MTNFLLVDFGSPDRAAATAEGLLARGLVPRTFGAGHLLARTCASPSATAARTTASSRPPASSARRPGMTTPLGTLDVTDRGTRRVSVSRRTRETDIDVTLDLDGTGVARDLDRARASTTTS